ncbi:sigma-70 family RNA polymerase sigma factor [Yangia mangrovi]|uniref:RNA polymerase sigma factor n=1 Tax=Alloyangia mangrovi TaxID=1779329 RepID=A0A2A3JY36_9RHOB|nr:sigma-70 family RNA polymerase sigma factor [Alloyangia mangrovi]
MSLDGRLTTPDAFDAFQPEGSGSVNVVLRRRSKESRVTPAERSEQTQWLLAVRDQRDREAFGRLFDFFAPRLKAMLIRGGLRDGSAEDVVQDVMISVWNKASQFDPHRAEASAWIYRIARNRQIDLYRRKPLPEPELLQEPESSEPDAPQILAMEQEAAQLREALQKLRPEQIEALRHAYMDELPHSEISRITGLPLGTIKSRIRLGLDRLRRDLTDLRPQ